MNVNFEKYIEGLDPKMQEKARQCKTKEEILDFVADNDIELPGEALEMVSGGCSPNHEGQTPYCKKCGGVLHYFPNRAQGKFYCTVDYNLGYFDDESLVDWR